MRPETNAPSIMPPIIGTKNQAKLRSFNPSRSSTNAGAEAMYRNSAPKLKVQAAASRWKRGLTKIAR